MNIKQMIEKKRVHIEKKISKINALVENIFFDLADEKVDQFIDDETAALIELAEKKLGALLQLRKNQNASS